MSSLLAISSMTSSETKDVPSKHPFIINKARKNKTTSMRNADRKDDLMSDNDNEEEEEEEGILTNKAPMNASPDIENNKVKRRKKKKNKLTPLNDNEVNPPVKVNYTKDQGTQTKDTMKVADTKEQATQTKKQQKSSIGKKTSFIVLCSKGIIMVAAIVLISSSEEITKAKPCDLEKALKSISVNYNFPCKHHAIKEKATNLRVWGISLLILNFLYFILILISLLMPQIRKMLHPDSLMPKRLKIALFCLLACEAIIFSIAMVMSYIDVQKTKAAKSDINFNELKKTMFNLLENNYTSDNISSNNALSNNWNKFFIEYNCCAINQVTGTTNDFDSTPWCTTAGTCQATASQIPKTCCNYVSDDDYGNAPSTCHSSVNSGTYKSNCMIAIKLLSDMNIEEYKISLLQVSLLIIATLEIADAILMLILTTEYAIFFKSKYAGRSGEWK